MKTCRVGGDEDADEGKHVFTCRLNEQPPPLPTRPGCVWYLPGDATTVALLPFNNWLALMLTWGNRYAGVGATATEAGCICSSANWNRLK